MRIGLKAGHPAIREDLYETDEDPSRRPALGPEGQRLESSASQESKPAAVVQAGILRMVSAPRKRTAPSPSWSVLESWIVSRPAAPLSSRMPDHCSAATPETPSMASDMIETRAASPNAERAPGSMATMRAAMMSALSQLIPST